MSVGSGVKLGGWKLEGWMRTLQDHCRMLHVETRPQALGDDGFRRKLYIYI